MATKVAKKVEVLSMPSRDLAQEKKWQAESDLRTLQAAKEIEASRARLSAAKRIAEEQMKALAKIKMKK
jgi:hypothetical protein